MFRCTSCSYRCEIVIDLIKHLFSVHSVEPNFFFVCGINGCLHAFKCGASFSSFKTHATRKHQGWQDNLTHSIHSFSSLYALLSDQQHESQMMSTTTVVADTGNQSDQCSSDSDSEPIELVPESVQPLLQIPNLHSPSSLSNPMGGNPERVAAMFLLTLQEKYKVSQAAINFCVGSINSIVEAVSSDSLDLFANLKTDYLQTKYYQREFGLVVCPMSCIMLLRMCMHAFPL